MSKNVIKNISKNLKDNLLQVLLKLMHLKQLKQLMMWLAIKSLIKLQNSIISPQKSSLAVTNETENIELDREIPKERNISPEKRQKLLMI